MLYTFLAMMIAALPLQAATSPTVEPVTIQAEQLKAWYDQNQSIVVLDARSTPYFDGTLLPGALWVSYETSEAAIEALIPNKSEHIVVYCWSVDCPASGWLYDKLTAMGYQHIYEYREGLSDWLHRGYPVKAPT